MKLIVPHTGELQKADARLIRLAQFLGISCEPLLLDKQARQYAAYFEKAIPDRSCCLVINPQVMREWIGEVLPDELSSFLASYFPHLLVHGLTLDPFVGGMIASLSGGALLSVHPVEDAGRQYDIPKDARDVCGPFSGLSFGPINLASDRVFAAVDGSAARQLIRIGGQPFMASVQRDKAEILFIAGEDTVDIASEGTADFVADVSDLPMSGFFSRLVPHAMALRRIWGEACWRPCKPRASVIIDDPLLRPQYGHLKFETLARLAEKHNFHATIAFIPHNYRRNSARIVRMFRERPSRLSICFHGNDHTRGELASTNTALLNTLLGIAQQRMKALEQRTGLRCSRVMVFPQGGFSVEAMEVLKARNFHAAVNTTPKPAGRPSFLAIADLAQPAALRYGDFPLFFRTYVNKFKVQDIAFALFFGRPALLVEHHDIFKSPDDLVEAVHRVNSVAPDTSWSSLESAVDNAILKRRAPDGTVQVRAYASSVRVENDSASVERLSIAWDHAGANLPVECVLRDEVPCPGVEAGDAGIRVSAELAPGASSIFSVVRQNSYATLGSLGFRWDAKAFLRRRLSEVRDNYVSKNQFLLTGAKTLKRRLSK